MYGKKEMSKKPFKKYFLLASRRSQTKRAGSGSGSGSVTKFYRSGTLLLLSWMASNYRRTQMLN
jgi:hypothetical protein